MSKPTTEAGEWMRQNGHSWGKTKRAPGGKKAKEAVGPQVRERRASLMGARSNRVPPGSPRVKYGTVKNFVHQMRNHTGCDCVFVPAAQKNVPAAVTFCGKHISAARYMCLLTHGVPKYEGAVARHTCGNGHLSCVNPNHIVWGDVGDNQSDANHHRAAGDNVQDRINSVTR